MDIELSLVNNNENKGMNGGSKHYLVETKDDEIKQDEMDEYWKEDFIPSNRGMDEYWSKDFVPSKF